MAEDDLLFFLDGVPHRLTVGDMITVPASVPHSFQTLTSCVRLVDAFAPIREDFLEQPSDLA